MAGRAYVFEDYTSSHSPLAYTIYDFALRATRIPLNAFVAGPLSGGPLPSPDERAFQKRAVSAAFYEKVCPRAAIHSVSSVGAPTEAEGSALIEWWVKRLSEVQARVRPFPLRLPARALPPPRPLRLSHPRHLRVVTLVHSAVVRNFAVLRPTDPAALYPPPRRPLASRPDATTDPHRTLAGLVAVHLRRGDYKRLAQWGAGYMGFNSHPSLPDRFTIPPFENITTKEDIEDYYLVHCLPSPEQLAARLHAVRAEHAQRHPGAAPLRRVYILTNTWGWFVNSVRKELVRDGWEEVWGSVDIVLDAAQTGVGMAVDMRIGEGAEVFLGNGFSSLTSNIVMLRLARGLEPASNRPHYPPFFAAFSAFPFFATSDQKKPSASARGLGFAPDYQGEHDNACDRLPAL
ncbi:hypothetical protein C8F04DRAFT_1250167 [Mycena alexandri]|uniref:Fucosyltransferase n=1 Tax=Mycena alexandri TaxID=1745969 RepID=A0AAD6TD28_9AGAR|nr:hypothetical protein C8F04DRAFT_1250167 [Mycena alexandri]